MMALLSAAHDLGGFGEGGGGGGAAHSGVQKT